MILVKGNGTVFYGPNLVTNGLVLYLDAANINSYPGSGTAWNNLISGSNTSLLLPAYNTLNYGNMSFNGVNNYLTMNSTLQVNTQTGFTMDMVININQAQTTYTNNWAYFFTDGNIEMGTYYTSQGVNNSFHFKDNGASASALINSGAIAGSWYNITIGCNNTIPFMYKNGVLVGTASAFNSATWSINKLFLRQTDLTRNYAANLGLFRVYNRALSASEIYQNYLATKSRFALNDNFWNNYKRNVASIYDAVVNPDGELIWNTLPANIASNFSLQIMPYAMRAGQIIAGDNLGNTVSLTHTRGTLATFVDKDGYIKYCVHNLSRYSETFTVGSWGGAATRTTTDNATIAPNGTTTGCLLSFSSSNSSYINQVQTNINDGSNFTVGVYVKSTGIGYLPNILFSDGGTSVYFGVIVNTSTGAITSQLNVGGGSMSSCSSTSVGNGWYKILISGKLPVSTPTAGISLNGNNAGGAGSIYIWGAHLRYTNSIDAYIKTTSAAVYLPRWAYDSYTADYLGWLTEPTAAINLLTYNSDYTNVWTRNSFSVTSSTILSPDGINTAQILYNSNVAPQLIQNIGTPSTISNYTITCFVKSISQQYVYLQAQSYNTVTNYSRISFDLINVTATFSDVGGTGYTATASNIELYRDGWLRLSATFILPTDGSIAVLGFSKTYGPYTQLDSGVVNQIYLWGFQAETGDKASSLIPTYASQVTRNADNILIPTVAGQYFTAGSCYLEASTKRLNGVASRWLYMTSGSGNILYSSSDNAGNQVIVWDGVNAASKSTTGYPTYDISKMFSSWGPLYGLKITQNSLSVATASFDGGMGLSNSTSITFGGDTGNSSVNTMIRSCLLFNREMPDINMQDWTNSSKFLAETPYKTLKSFTSSNIYFIPEGDSQYQRLTDYIRNNASMILVAGAFNGNTIYGLNSNGGTVSYLHTRGSLATQINRNGVIEYCAHNLCLWSENISSSSSDWANTGITNSSTYMDIITNPLTGLLTGDKLAEIGGTSNHRITKNINIVASGVSINFSAYLKSAERTFGVLYEGQSTTGYYFNLSNGTIGTAIGTGVIASITASNGWYLCSITLNTINTVFSPQIYTAQSDGGGLSFAGTTDSGIYVWGMQVRYNNSMLNAYISTTSSVKYAPRYTYNSSTKVYEGWLLEGASVNMVNNSSDFDNIANGTVSSNVIIAPDGTLTGDLFTATASLGLAYSSGPITSALTTYVGSIFVKKSNASTVMVALVSSAAYGGVNPSVLFNFDTQAFSSGANFLTYSYQQYNNGWFRVALAATSSSISGTGIRVQCISASDSVYIWGSQFEAATVPTSYIPTYGAQVTRNTDTFVAAASNNMINLGALYMNIRTSKILQTQTSHSFTDLGSSNVPFWTNNVATRVQATNTDGANFYSINANPGSFLDNTFNKLALTWGNNTWQQAGRGQTGSPGVFGGTMGTGILAIPTFNVGNNLQGVNILNVVNIPLKLNDTDLRNLTL